MRKVKLKMNEQLKYDVIKLVVQGKKSKSRAAVTLGVTIRTVNRLIVKYKTSGKEGFIHANRLKVKSETKFDTIRAEIISLYEIKYEGFNYAHFHEKLVEDEGYTVSESTVRKWLNSEGFISPKANRKTKREHKKLQLIQDNPSLCNEDTDLDAIAEIELCDAHPTRERKKYMGELIQLDASDHMWFGIKKTSLHAAIDDASGKIVGLYFDNQETLNGYYNVFKQILTDYGIPYEFITDRRTVFEYKKKNASLDKDTFTQFSYACKTLGTHITTSSVPQAKGRIERLFNTLQSRLISELRLNNIETLTEANKYLDSFKEKFNLKFSLLTQGYQKCL